MKINFLYLFLNFIKIKFLTPFCKLLRFSVTNLPFLLVFSHVEFLLVFLLWLVLDLLFEKCKYWHYTRNISISPQQCNFLHKSFYFTWATLILVRIFQSFFGWCCEGTLGNAQFVNFYFHLGWCVFKILCTIRSFTFL